MEGQIMETADFLKNAFALIDAADKRGIKMRLLGSIAIRVHCPNNVYLLDQMKRVLTDIDFMAYKSQRDSIRRLLEEMGYVMDANMAMIAEGGRYFFQHRETGLGIDVFMDKLDYCHPISFKNRLELDKPTIDLADLVLEKLQIVEINEKDLKDMYVLLLEHDFGKSSQEEIDLDYIARLLSDDWGFYYTVTTNLEKLKTFLPHFEALDQTKRDRLVGAIDYMKSQIEASPKSFGWKMRARVGTKKKWYKDVGEKDSGFDIDGQF